MLDLSFCTLHQPCFSYPPHCALGRNREWLLFRCTVAHICTVIFQKDVHMIGSQRSSWPLNIYSNWCLAPDLFRFLSWTLDDKVASVFKEPYLYYTRSVFTACFYWSSLCGKSGSWLWQPINGSLTEGVKANKWFIC